VSGAHRTVTTTPCARLAMLNRQILHCRSVPSHLLAHCIAHAPQPGLRYTNRIDQYTKMCAVLLVGLLVMLFANGLNLAIYGQGKDTMLVHTVLERRRTTFFYILE